MKDKLSPTPWYWSEDDFHGGLFGLFDANDEDVLVPITQNEGDTGAAWFEEFPDKMDFSVIAAAGLTYKALKQVAPLIDYYQMKAEVVAERLKNYDGYGMLERVRAMNTLVKEAIALAEKEVLGDD